MAFNFDGDDNGSDVQRTASAKAINKPAGLWIAHDNQELVGWDESRWLEPGSLHNVETREVINDAGDFKMIPGVLIREPKLLIVGRSPLLAETKDKLKKIIGLWNNERDKSAGNKAVRMYQLIFLDANNQPYHLTPIQLKARGHFSISFEQVLILGGKNLTVQKISYRKHCEQLYSELAGKRPEAKNDKWHSVWIFCPTFKSEMRGKDDATKSPACVTYGYKVSTKETWEQFCLGRSELAHEITAIFDEQVDFWKVKTLENKPTTNLQQNSGGDPFESSNNNHNELVKNFRLKLDVSTIQIIDYLKKGWNGRKPSELTIYEVNRVFADLLEDRLLKVFGMSESDIENLQLNEWIEPDSLNDASFLAIYESIAKERSTASVVSDDTNF